MPPKKASKATTRCSHSSLTYGPTAHAAEVGFEQQTHQQRLTATTPRGTLKSVPKTNTDPVGTCPAPLILPDDDLALDPKHPPQSLRSWLQGKWRNVVTPETRTIYLAMPPEYDTDMESIKKWAQPRQKKKVPAIQQPKAQDVLEYLEAFYHGLPVKIFPTETLRFASEVGDLDDMSKDDKKRQIIGLNFKKGYASKGIRTRAKPKGDYSHQMNLNDILTAAIWAVPEDAYALIMLVEHDMYEDEEDEFVCGRAYGGSRVAVITTARYNPVLDKTQGVEREHAWPASHCTAYLNSMLDEESQTKNRKRKRGEPDNEDKEQTPLQAAISAHHSLPSLETSPSAAALSGLWLGRVCRTASHELGHCFGMGHCVYYACSMQGSASIQEDARQPSYLCPVDLAKILHTTGADMNERYQALLRLCEKHGDVHFFAACAAWIRGRMRELEVEQSQENSEARPKARDGVRDLGLLE
jgi:archaemetzincin